MTVDTHDPVPGVAGEQPVKPKLRGWLHLVMSPIAFFAGLTICVFAPTLAGRVGGAVYLLASLMLFVTSATYHLGSPWPDKIQQTFRRADHANIFIFIAGTYTPLCLTLLEGRDRITLLSLIWGIGVLGVGFRMAWLSAPRWLYTLLYVAMGWAAVGWLPQFWAAGGPAVVVLIIVGGVIYSLGAVAYALRRPNPSPAWFGFHEVFHACTVLAALCHYVAIALAVF